MLIAGLHYPLTAAIMGAGWSLSRVVYLVGYMRPSWGADGAGRLRGSTHILFLMGLITLAATTSVQLVMKAW
jgi:glutathione S-transferase